MTARRVVATALVGLVLATHAFIDLDLAAPIPLPGGRTWQADAPVADLAALALLPLGLLAGLRAPRAALPGWVGQVVLLAAAALSIQHAIDPAGALHHLVRKPLFVYLAYGLGLSWAVARLVPPRHLARLVVAAVALTAAVSLLASAGRIAAGDTLWYQRIEGLTPNHKTLAVCLAGWLPLLVTLPGAPRGRRLALGLAAAAVLLSLSKTAWITALLAAALFLPRGRPLAWRPRLVLPGLALAFALAYYAPVLVQSRTMLDAARSRHSLNVRSWEMFRAHPLVGSGTGMSTEVEMVVFPHYRVNGVDAHGVLQKTAAETGLLGLLGMGLFVGLLGRDLHRRWRGAAQAAPAAAPTTLVQYGCLGSFVALHANLLLSTEVHSPTHWVPLATALGLSQLAAPEEPPCAS